MNNTPTLEQVRKEWEKGLALKLTIDQTKIKGRFYSILMDLSGKHTILRYFEIAGHWECSVDKINIPLAELWQYIEQIVNPPHNFPRPTLGEDSDP